LSAPDSRGLTPPPAPPAQSLTPAPLAPPPARPAPPHVTTLSYSGLADYARCGYRFYLERSLRLPATPAPEEPPAEAEGLPGTQRGTLAHRLLEDLDFARPKAPSAEAVRAVADELGIPVTDDDLTDLAGLVGSFAAAPLCARLAAATVVRREAPFAYPLQAPEGEVLLHGFIDVIAREGDRALVVDYKSDRLEPEGGDPAERVERDYRTQRLVYALAALRDGADEVEVTYCFLERAEEPVSVTFAAPQAQTLEAELTGLAGGILAGDFPVSATPHRWLCGTCPGRHALCSWEPEMTLRDPPEPS
jgi:ATP-dependent helicase/nuclease subunit A